MSTVTRPRGPLPPRVYWTRRVLVLGVALALVFGIGRLLGGSPEDAETATARPAAAPASTAADGQTPQAGPTLPVPPAQGDERDRSRKNDKAGTKEQGKDGKAAEEKTPLAVPTGPCADSDIEVNPTVDGDAFAGQDVVVTLNLTTEESPACTWEVSPESVVLKLTSGEDRIWSTQDCPEAVPTESVVVRQADVTQVEVTWPSRRSDDDCTPGDWAMPGYYHAEAAALGGEPEDEQFHLLTPPRPTITATPKPTKKDTDEKSDQQD